MAYAKAADYFPGGGSKMRGYFGVGIVSGKSPENVGGLWRSAHAFGASMIFTVAFRSPRQATDTSKAARHVPLFEWADWDTFLAHRPEGCELVAVEQDAGGARAARMLPDFRHPKRALYLLGSEDRGLNNTVLAACESMVEIPSSLCLNVATVMYDRNAKARLP
jgi:tRNA G18 (ribose-2'-O)-methylase SpoU